MLQCVCYNTEGFLGSCQSKIVRKFKTNIVEYNRNTQGHIL
jgi:hypothetical protein